jgi:formate dehydrogenase major subunit
MMADTAMPKTIAFSLDGHDVEARADETIWQVAHRLGTEIPHLCYAPEPGYRPDGNCRACMVEIEGERVLAAACIRKPAPGMKVKTASERARASRRMVFELLMADQPERLASHDPHSRFWRWANRIDVTESRFPEREMPMPDRSHPAMAVNLDACINCNLCVRACREVQVNDVIGMAGRGAHAKVVFDLDDPMGASTCVACGECVQACPTGALMPASLVDAANVRTGYADRKVDSVCPYCGVGCQLTYHIKDDRLLYVTGREGPANENRLCVKGRFGFDYVHHPHRLTQPLIRKDGVPKDAGDNVDPANPWTHFRPASWEEALARAAGGLKRVRDAHGGGALAGFGSAKGSNEEAYLFQKLVRTGFGTNNVDHCTRLCHASSVAALMEGIGSAAVTAPFTACRDAEVIIVIGANPTENHPVAATYFKQAAKRGAKLIVMDPRGQALKRHATHMLQFKPNKDVALLNAMLNVIITEGLYDQQYVQGFTENFAALKEHVQAFPPEKMEPECGIPAATIREVARLYARSRASIIFWGMGISQSVHGTDNARCLIALALTTGQIGRPGTGLHPLRGQNNVQGASDAGLIPMVFPDYRSVENADFRAAFERAWGTRLDPKRGLTVVEIVNAILRGEIRAMYIMGENPAMSDPDAHHAREALARLEHLVVQDIFLTETAWHADVVLPASAWPEKDGTVTNTNRQVQMGRRALPMPGQARQDWEIIQQIARGMGLAWNYAGPHEVFAEMAGVMPSLANITWDRLARESAVTYPCPAPDRPGHDIVFGDGFPTASRRGKLVPAAYGGPGEPTDDEYPMVLTTGRQLEHWHTGAMTRRASVLDTIEPAPVACLSPDDLARFGVQGGDRIRVSTRRGSIELSVRVDAAVPSGMVFIPFCYAEAAANLLTSPQLDPMGKIPEFKYCAARVEKADGTRQAAE